MKFIHTSDWHIGRQFHNVSLLDDQRHVLQQLLAYVQEHQVDAVVIAGDIYDRSVPPAAAVELLDDVLHALCMEQRVPVVLIPGNHDSAERVRFGSRQMQQAGLHIVGNLADSTQPVVLRGAHGEVHFHCIPYNDPEHVRSEFANELEETGEEIRTHDQAHSWLVNRIHARRNTQAPCVLVSHCFVDGAMESESERPLSVGGAERVSAQSMQDFAYVALGHLHAPQHQGAGHIRYSGSLLKYSFSEASHAKGVTLVELDAQGKASHRHLPLQPQKDVRVIEGYLQDILQAGQADPRNQDYVLVRLQDREAILDIMAKLRAVYPNVLHVERPGLVGEGAGTGEQLSRDSLKRSETDIFADFYREMRAEEMTDAQRQVIGDIVKALQNGETA